MYYGFAEGDSTLTLPSNATTEQLARLGYTFEGFFTNDAFSGSAITQLENSTGSGTLDLYAKWTPVTYTITYEKNGGTQTEYWDKNVASTYTIENKEFALPNYYIYHNNHLENVFL